MKVFNLCAKVTKRHLVSLGVYLGIFAVLAVMLTAFNNTSQSFSFEAVRPSTGMGNRRWSEGWRISWRDMRIW